jgi:hypothetical protein
MAGLVPAIHVFADGGDQASFCLDARRLGVHHAERAWPRAWKVRLIHAANPDWRDWCEDLNA